MFEDTSGKESLNHQNDGEITLKEVFCFLRDSWQAIVYFGCFGLLAGFFFILLTPNSYEAISQIRMAQVITLNSSNPFGTSIEDPNSLISRIQIPSNIAKEAFNSCVSSEKVDPVRAFYKAVKLAPIKSIPNAVELKVTAPTAELAEKCSSAVYENIKNSQADLSARLLEEARLKLEADDTRIESARKLMATAHQLGAAMPAAYLTARDELTFYLSEREKIVELINSIKNRGTTLISPIYVSDEPVSPKRVISILAGLIIGILLGLLFAYLRQFLKKSTKA